jgi:hypothetical protein
MKTSMYLLMAILLLAVGSCKKQTINTGKNAMGAAPPLMYEVLDKSGKSILDTINSLTDSLTLSWNDNGVAKQFSDPMLNLNYLPESATSATLQAGYKKYNGIAAVDYKMIALSAGVESPAPPAVLVTPVHAFTLSYHGKNLGSIHFQLLQVYDTWVQAKVFTFNNVPVTMDTTNGKHLYVIQLQQ